MGTIQFIGKFVYKYPGFSCCKIHNVEASKLQKRKVRLNCKIYRYFLNLKQAIP